MNNQLPASPVVERKHDAVFATAETDNHSTYLLINGVKIRAYLAGGVVNISVDLTDGTVSADDETVRYAIHTEGPAPLSGNQRAGVPRNLLTEQPPTHS